MTSLRIILSSSALISVALVLSGCATEVAETPLPAPTDTVTTAPETTAPEAEPRTPDSPVNAVEAFEFCRGEVLEFSMVNDTDASNLNDFDESLVSEDEGTFTVQLKGEMGDRAMGAAYCAVGGTVGAPTLVDYQFIP